MKTRAEHLPTELWLSIFSYLEVHDLFQAFRNLNSYFEQLLASNHLEFRIELRKNDSNYFQCPNGVYLSDSMLNRTISLQSLDEHRGVYISRFLRFNSDKLIRLQSLIIEPHDRDLPIICKVLHETNSLRYLDIRCIQSQKLLEAILIVPILLICKSDILYSKVLCNSKWGKISHVETLYIKFHGVPNHSITTLLLSHMPKLRRLEVVESISSLQNQNPLFNQPLLVIKQLRTLKLSMNYDYIKLNHFEYLSCNMPVLKRFYLFTYCHRLNSVFIENLNKHWWLHLQTIPRIKIFIQCDGFDEVNINMEIERRKFVKHCRTNLLMINNRTDTCFKIKKIEDNSGTYKWEIEISIF